MRARDAAMMTSAAQKSARGHERGCGLLKAIPSARAANRTSPAKRYHRGIRGFDAGGAEGL